MQRREIPVGRQLRLGPLLGWPHRNGFQSRQGNAASRRVLGRPPKRVKEASGMNLRFYGSWVFFADEIFDRRASDDLLGPSC
jgi:hypothetical protein